MFDKMAQMQTKEIQITSLAYICYGRSNSGGRCGPRAWIHLLEWPRRTHHQSFLP